MDPRWLPKEKSLPERETYILDDDDLQQLADTSLTGVMREITSTMELEIPDADDLEGEIELDFGMLDEPAGKS